MSLHCACHSVVSERNGDAMTASRQNSSPNPALQFASVSCDALNRSQNRNRDSRQQSATVKDAGTRYDSRDRCLAGPFFSWLRLPLRTARSLPASETVRDGHSSGLDRRKPIFRAFWFFDYRHPPRHQIQDELLPELLRSACLAYFAAVLRSTCTSRGLDTSWMGQSAGIVGVFGTQLFLSVECNHAVWSSDAVRCFVVSGG